MRRTDSRPRLRTRHLPLGIAAAALLCAGASGQQLRFSIPQFGPALILRSMSDLDSDGIREIAVGDPIVGGTGEVRAYSGATGALLFRIPGTENGARFGDALAVGDVDGDGLDDLEVGSPLADVQGADSGRVQIFSGANQQLLLDLPGAHAGDRFGSSVAHLQRASGPAVLVGSPRFDPSSALADAGRAEAFDAISGTSVFHFDGVEATSFLGAAVATLTGPRGRYVVSAPLENGSSVDEGAVRVFLASNGQLLSTLRGSNAFEHYGEALASIPSTDGDSTDEFLVSATLIQPRVELRSGISASLLFEHHDNENGYGVQVSRAGDLDGDGVEDVLVSSPNEVQPGGEFGAVELLSGKTGQLLYHLCAAATFSLIAGIGDLDDLDGDGIAEFLVGDFKNGLPNVEVRSGNDLFLNVLPAAAPAGQDVELLGRNGEVGARGLLALTAVDGTPLFVPFLHGLFDGSGVFGLEGPFPPGLSGHTYSFFLLSFGPQRGLQASAVEVLRGL